MPKLTTAALLAAALAFGASPAHSAEAATPDDTARFLAGLPPAAASPLAALARDPIWQQHARYFDTIFAREDSVTLSKVRAFSRDQLPEKHEAMLYTFSGPDFLYATSFFPNASTYVLAGLEPVGDIPSLTSLGHPAIDGSLRNLETALGSLLSFSFFITKNMKTQLHEGPVYGTLPILYVFLARTGKTVHDVSFVNLDAEGNVRTVGEVDDSGAAKRSLRSAAQGVKITFSEGGGPTRTLYYFSTNLADGSIEHTGFLPFCAKLGPTDSFIKSASYLMHGGGFTKVRAFLLGHSATILQDDSGIPLAYFDRREWHLQGYGRYVGPLNIFGHSYQPEMAELFQQAIPIDFGVGYRWRKNESNLLLAQKATPTTSDDGLTPHLPSDHYARGAIASQSKKPRSAGASAQSRKKKTENESTTVSLGCRVAGIFPFCSDPPPKPSR
jgi:hypothetical protein